MPTTQSAVRFQFVGVDAHIDPADRIVFTKVFGEFVRANGAMWAVRPMGSYEFAEDYRSEIMRQRFPWTEAGR